MPQTSSYFSDLTFVDELLQFIVHDAEFLKYTSHLLSVNDFRRRTSAEGGEREIVAKLALDFWNKYRSPLGKFVRMQCRDLAKRKQMNEERKNRLMDYAGTFMNGHKRVAANLILEKVRQYKFEHNVASALQQVSELIESGALTPEQFTSITAGAVEGINTELDRPVNIFLNKELENRITRRIIQSRRPRFPVLLIDPIDRRIRIVAKKHMGLVLAPYARGKSMFFVWIALAYALQGLNVLHFTLEDPQEDVEDRFDAAISALPISRLMEVPDELRQRFQQYKRVLRGRIKVVDGTDGTTTMQRVESVYEQERNRGWNADVINIDYDDEIRPVVKNEERRFEFAEVYKDFRALIARHNCIGWTASQTDRKSEDLKIVGGKHTAEDISKVRKASFAMSIGQGEWGEDSVFLWVVRHRNDAQHFGSNIMQNKECSLFYDREESLKRERIERENELVQQRKELK